MKAHELKSHIGSFSDIWNGKKLFEYRNNDRSFEIGDILVLQEFNPETGMYTTREMIVGITYISTEFGIPEGFCILGITRPVYRRTVE